MKRFRALRTTLVIAGAIFLCAQMSAELTVRRCRRAAETGAPGLERPRTVLSLFIGKLEELVGDVLLLKADNYFHGQTSLLGQTRVGKCDCMHEHHEHAHEHHEDAHGHGHEAHHNGHEAEHHGDHEAHRGTGALSYDHFLYRQYLKVAPTVHVHLHRREEIVPWLYASVRLNAGNERAAVLTAYWLGRQLDRPREAEQVLRAALAVRPSSWRLQAALAWLHYHEGRFGPALRQCTSAIRLFEPVKDEEQARLELAELWRLASVCHETLGNLERAVACAETVARILPECRKSPKRLVELRARLEAESPAQAEPSDPHSSRP